MTGMRYHETFMIPWEKLGIKGERRVEGWSEGRMNIGGTTEQEGNMKLSETAHLRGDIYKTPLLNDTR